MNRRSKAASAAAALVLVVIASCTTEEAAAPLPEARETADAFIQAWSDLDAAAMSELAGEPRPDPMNLERLLERQLRRGDVTAFEVASAGRVPQPEPPGDEVEGVATRAPYRLTYRSDAAAAPVSLLGEFELVFDEEEERWSVAWDEDLMWPGIEGGTRLTARYRWPRRAEIVDRNGRMLARGHGRGRRYPFGSVGGAIVGHLTELDRAAAREAGPGYGAGDLAGGSGLEKGYESRLAGKPWGTFGVESSEGEIVAVLSRKLGRPGRRVRATLSVDVQRAAEEVLGGTVGGAVALDPRTGDVLGAAGSISFDPNAHVGATDIEPFDRAFAGRYPPGSAMKVVTAAAALDSGVVSPRTTVTGPEEYKGVRNFESGVFGAIDFATALRESVNTAFAQVAEEVGSRRLTRYARRFGFDLPVALALEAAESSFPVPEDPWDLMWSSIGQAQVLATPLQMASIAATVANGGIRMEPRVALNEPERSRRVIKRRTARTLTNLMQSVVASGTGTGASVPGAAVAGKTGTAEVDVGGERRNHAWFIAFAPAGNPRVAGAVVAEHGGVGGRVAAPLAGRLLQRVLPLVR